jgi:hypothetical protein
MAVRVTVERVAECLVVELGHTPKVQEIIIHSTFNTSTVAITDGFNTNTGGRTRTLNAVDVMPLLVTALSTALFNVVQQVKNAGGMFNVST